MSNVFLVYLKAGRNEKRWNPRTDGFSTVSRKTYLGPLLTTNNYSDHGVIHDVETYFHHTSDKKVNLISFIVTNI